MKSARHLGPGLLVVAAFIGPGTVTTASVAGARFGLALLWAVAFSVVATIVLQEMAARLGVVSRHGLGEALRTAFRRPSLRIPVLLLVVAGIACGNAAFETGNIVGAALALTALTGLPAQLWVLAIAVWVFVLLAGGGYRIIERILITVVAGMSIVFLLTATTVQVSARDLMAGLWWPSLPEGAAVTVMALIGTTIVPYNLFLHASAVQERWPAVLPLGQALTHARFDTCVSIALGGVITVAIVVTAAAAFFGRGMMVDNAATMAEQLEPLLGSTAKILFACGLFGAGLTSAITAPLAAAYATAGVLGWERNLQHWKFRAIWCAILLVGTLFAFFGRSPVTIILLAQAANGFLLPLIAAFLLMVMNRKDLLQTYTNGPLANTLGTAVVLIVAGLGLFQTLKALGMMEG